MACVKEFISICWIIKGLKIAGGGIMRLRSSKLVTLTALLLMSLCLTSCKDQQYLREVDYSSTFATAKKRNQEVIINLWHAGVISEASKTEYVDRRGLEGADR